MKRMTRYSPPFARVNGLFLEFPMEAADALLANAFKEACWSTFFLFLPFAETLRDGVGIGEEAEGRTAIGGRDIGTAGTFFLWVMMLWWLPSLVDFCSSKKTRLTFKQARNRLVAVQAVRMPPRSCKAGRCIRC